MRHPKIPILKLYNCLLVSIQWELDDQTALHFQEDLLNKIYETGANGVVIDLTSVDMIDSFIAKVLGDVITMSKLMGAKVVLTGIQPAVAVTLIELGISLEEIETALDLEQGLETLKRNWGNSDERPILCENHDRMGYRSRQTAWPQRCEGIRLRHGGPGQNHDGYLRIGQKHLLICRQGPGQHRTSKRQREKGLKIIAEDKGPGIPDIRKVMEDGFSTSGGLGAGLPGVKRLMDEFSLQSVAEEGTEIQAVNGFGRRLERGFQGGYRAAVSSAA